MSSNTFNPVLESIEDIRSSWGWFLLLGILSIILGLCCIAFNISATFASVLVFGWVLLFSGAVALVQAFQTKSWRRFFLYLLNAIFRGVTGYTLIRYPLMGAETLTIMLSSFFIVGGVFRAVASGVAKFPRWGWVALSGVVSTIVGATLLARMPMSGLWFIGFALGVELISTGLSEIAVATAVRSLPSRATVGPA